DPPQPRPAVGRAVQRHVPGAGAVRVASALRRDREGAGRGAPAGGGARAAAGRTARAGHAAAGRAARQGAVAHAAGQPGHHALRVDRKGAAM
ncbi:MAG: Cell division protein FtsL, partial [uncultured Ramlibacter sp.]